MPSDWRHSTRYVHLTLPQDIWYVLDFHVEGNLQEVPLVLEVRASVPVTRIVQDPVPLFSSVCQGQSPLRAICTLSAPAPPQKKGQAGTRLRGRCPEASYEQRERERRR